MADSPLERLQRGGVETDAERDAALHEFIDQLDQSVGADVPCPICGGREWHATSSPVTFVTGQGSAPALLQAAMFTCIRCRFLRLHMLNPLLPGG